ncbi:hypothetical protein KYK29_00850 [Shinella daejeonensis]|uniref:hypothetical protein n=1 Tax=Shinella daejeonensis TaxID=659017 RepID=UPI0020C7BB31|nr:hypothetical protein [Shinella daejeonensis]MCP8893459.1 hypothetical protein [Shinella daejeonensis]
MTTASPGTSIGSKDDAPLLSTRFLTRLTLGIAILAGLSVAVSLAGRTLGQRIALAGHSESTRPVDLHVGQDHLRLPENVIRFAEQRQDGRAERIDLYLAWPEMQGYSHAGRDRFNNGSRPEGLIFLNISQSTMSKDMSGRLAPIYRHIFAGTAESGPAGLSLHRLKPQSGYGDEIFFTGRLTDGSDYVVRCMIPAEESRTTSADCQRDIHLGRDLSVLYRFSSRLLPQWRSMEKGVRAYLADALTVGGSR